MAEKALQFHPFPPLYNKGSRVLILGSFPSVKSREEAFFYAHPQNRFWPLIAALFGKPVPRTVEEKAGLILSHRLALWDVIAKCEITGSSDASIASVEANDLRPILEGADVRAIFCNGGTSYDYYRRLCRVPLGSDAVKLPSTSPANARWTLPKLTEVWGKEILPYLR